MLLISAHLKGSYIPNISLNYYSLFSNSIHGVSVSTHVLKDRIFQTLAWTTIHYSIILFMGCSIYTCTICWFVITHVHMYFFTCTCTVQYSTCTCMCIYTCISLHVHCKCTVQYMYIVNLQYGTCTCMCIYPKKSQILKFL